MSAGRTSSRRHRDAPTAPPVRRWSWGDELAPVEELLARGGVLAIPTESSYGLAADPSNDRGVGVIFDIKGRSRTSPLPVVIAGPEQLARLGIGWPSSASGGCERLWPAALSLLLPMSKPLPAAAGSERLAVRVPAHRGLRRLLAALGHGLTATSANRAGASPILDPAELDRLLAGRDAMIYDGGVLAGGPPSTLVAVDPAEHVIEVLRPGRVEPGELRGAVDGLEVRMAPFSAATVEIPVEESA